MQVSPKSNTAAPSDVRCPRDDWRRRLRRQRTLADRARTAAAAFQKLSRSPVRTRLPPPHTDSDNRRTYSLGEPIAPALEVRKFTEVSDIPWELEALVDYVWEYPSPSQPSDCRV